MDPDSPKRVPVALSHKNVIGREPVLIRPRGKAIDAPPYKDTIGRWRTLSLFVETFDSLKEDTDGDKGYTKFTPIFTLREHPFLVPPSHFFYGRYEDNLIPSIRQVYLHFNDPTEFQFSTEVFASTYHWEHLCSLEWFKPYVAEWRRMLAKKLRGVGIAKMVEVTNGSDPKFALMAGKWLAEGKFAEPQTKGRPATEDKIALVKQERQIDKIFEDDAKRLGLESREAPSVFLDLNNDTKQ